MNLNADDIRNAEPVNIDPNDLPDTDFIMEEVIKIRNLQKKHENNEIFTNLNTTKFQKHLDVEFKKLKDDFPMIYEKTCNGTLEIERLRFMLKMQGEIRKRKVTSHEASVVVGQELVDNIVKPSLEEKN